jgi:putative FmdB family regulatory protein
MPIYEYECECGKTRETIRNFAEMDKPEICQCGVNMTRRISVVMPPIIKKYGRQMALDSLNSNNSGFPESPFKQSAIEATAAGL